MISKSPNYLKLRLEGINAYTAGQSYVKLQFNV